jgi:hypothetical protein
MWSALSDKRAGLSFTIAAGPRQRSHSRVRVPWDLRPYFTLSDLKHPFSSPPATRRTMVVFDPASARDELTVKVKVKYNLATNKLSSNLAKRQSQSHIANDGQSISKSWCRAPSETHDQICITL